MEKDKDQKDQEQHIDILKIKNYDPSNTANFIRNFTGSPEILRPISAPPPGLYDNKFEETLPGNEMISRPDYYYYYYSQKPLDPRLPKPLYKPPTHGMKFQTLFDQQNIEKMRKEVGYSEDDKNEEEDDRKWKGGLGDDGNNSPPVPSTSSHHGKHQGGHHGGYHHNVGHQGGHHGHPGGPGQQGKRHVKMNATIGPHVQKSPPMMQNQYMGQGMQGMGGQMPGMQPYYPGYQQYPGGGGYPMNPPQNYGYPQPYMGGYPQPYGMQPPQYQQGGYMMGQDPYHQQGMYQGGGGGGGGHGGGYDPYYQNPRQDPNYYQPNMNMMQGGGGPPQRGGKPGMAQPKSQPFVKPSSVDFFLSKSYEKCQDSQGSRIIQQFFEMGTEEEKDKLYAAIKPHAEDLMKDVFGNYVIQKILEKGSEQQKSELFQLMMNKMRDLSTNMYGCRVVQKALEEAKETPELLMELIQKLKGHVLEMIRDQNGNHVIQKCFECAPISDLEFIVADVESQIESLTSDGGGCRVIQKILEKSDAMSPRLANIYKKVMQNMKELCVSPFGNYIIQHIVEKGPEAEKSKLLKYLRDNFVSLSQNKFASNVAEKALYYGNEDFRREAMGVLIKLPEGGGDAPVIQVMKNEFGNYVVQRLIEQGTKEMRRSLRKVVEISNLEDLKANHYSKHVLSTLDKYGEGSKLIGGFH